MQTPDDHREQDDAEPQAPPELVAALKQLPEERPFIPPTVDEAVFRAARQHLERRQIAKPDIGGLGPVQDFARRLFRWAAWLTAATALLAAGFLAHRFLSLDSPTTLGMGGWRRVVRPYNIPAPTGADSMPAPAPAPAAPSFAQPGPKDILDALVLAKRLKLGSVSDPRWDVNGDGVVDERDVKAIAIQVVRLDKGGRT